MEVQITQYKRPNGHKVEATGNVSESAGELAENMILSCEVLSNDKIAIYGRYSNQNEEEEVVLLADNDLGDNNPNIVLEKVINKVAANKQDTEKV